MIEKQIEIERCHHPSIEGGTVPAPVIPDILLPAAPAPVPRMHRYLHLHLHLYMYMYMYPVDRPRRGEEFLAPAPRLALGSHLV